MTFVEWLQVWVPLIVGILTIGTVISGILYKIHKGFLNFIKDEIAEVGKEFKPNGGSSLKDQVNRLEVNNKDLNIKVDEIYNLLTQPSSKNSKPKN